MATTRRELLKAATTITLAGALPASASARSARATSQTETLSDEERATIDELVNALMHEQKVPALSLAFARPGALLFREAWGVVQWGGEAATPDHLFRIASATKPITAVAIFQLIERNYLRLDDPVFGAQGLLNDDFGADLPFELEKITVRHLLMHTAGGWPNDGRGPTLMWPQLEQREWLEWVLRRRPLQWEPGTHYAYSNVGYCLLGWIIRKLTAQSYAEFVRENIFAPCGIATMRLATGEQSAGEVRYYDQSGMNPYERNMERMEACGGWLATPTDLARFAVKFPTLLQPATLETMTAPGALNPNYACGWMVNATQTVWHSGGIAGSNAFMVRTKSGLSWTVLINTSNAQSLKALNQLMWTVARSVASWQA